jgi:tight adherence protein B
MLVLLAFFFGAGLVIALFYGSTGLPEQIARRQMQGRIDELVRGPLGDEAGSTDLIKGDATGMVPVLDKVIGQTSRGLSMAKWIEQSGVKTTVSGLLVISAGLGVVGFFIGAMISVVLLVRVVVAVACAAIPAVVVRIKRQRRFNKFEEQFPEGLDLMARALKAGHAFSTGLKMVADEMEDPVGPEFRKTFDEQNFGLPLKDSLANLIERMPLLDVRFFATAVLIQRDTGGNLAEILENLASVVRERFKILRQVRVYTAHGRFTGWVLLALPGALAVALAFINPDHMNLLFRERIGQTLLGIAAVMQFIGYMWIRVIIKIEV